MAYNLPNGNRDEDIVKEAVIAKVEQLSKDFEKKSSTQIDSSDYETTLKDLQNKVEIDFQRLEKQIILKIIYFILHSIQSRTNGYLSSLDFR